MNSPRYAIALLIPTLLSACVEHEEPFYEAPPTGSRQPLLDPHLGSSPPSSTTDPQPTTDVKFAEVLEIVESEMSYSIVRVRSTDGSEEWMAGPEIEVKVGQWVVAREPREVKNFPTKTKHGTFERITLTREMSVIDEATARHIASMGQIPVQGGAGTPAGNGVSTGKPSVAVPTVKAGEVPALEGGLRIVKVFADKTALIGKQVRIRGKVMRSSTLRGGIWTHLQDGTGAVENGDHDIVVILAREPEPGSIIVVSGRVNIGHEMAIGPLKAQPILIDAKVEGS